MSEINQLIPALQAMNALEPETALQEREITDSTEFAELENLCQANWSAILDNFDSILDGDNGKLIVIDGFEALTAQNYMTALETLGDMFRQNTISQEVMSGALRPSGRMQAFFVDNYQNARVQALLNDLKPRLTEYPEVQTFLGDVLSGTAKTEIDAFREAHQESAEGNIPIVLLDA